MEKSKSTVIPVVVEIISDIFTEVSSLANKAEIGSDFSYFVSNSKGKYWICLIRKKTRSNMARRFVVNFDPNTPDILHIRYFVSDELSDYSLDMSSSDWRKTLMVEGLIWASKLSFEQSDSNSDEI